MLVVLAEGAGVTEQELIGNDKARPAGYKARAPASGSAPGDPRHRHREGAGVQGPRAVPTGYERKAN